MKGFFLISIFLASFVPVAHAQNAPTCGKTVEECQKSYEELGFAYQAVRAQRDGLQIVVNDAAAQSFVAQQAAAKTAGQRSKIPVP